jgi:hypothetical protein
MALLGLGEPWAFAQPVTDVALLDTGRVVDLVSMPDGSTVLAGNLTHLNGQPHASQILRRLPDGTLAPGRIAIVCACLCPCQHRRNLLLERGVH